MNEELIAAVVSAICYVESGHKANAINIDDGGSASYGYCQVKLATARMMGFKGNVTELWFDQDNNKSLAQAYFRYQLARCGSWDTAITAYNTGSCKKKSGAYLRKVRNANPKISELH